MNRLRSLGSPWTEALLALRSMVVGMEDHEFWHGDPDDPNVNVQQGWQNLPMRAKRVKMVDGEWIWRFRPSPEDNAAIMDLIVALLTRKQMTTRKKHVSRTGVVK